MPGYFRQRAFLELVVCLAPLGALAGCQGDILGSDSAHESTSGGSGVGGGRPSPAGAAGIAPTPPTGSSAGPQPLRRMTSIEYENTVRDLLHLNESFTSGLPADARGEGGYLLAGPVGEVDAEGLGSAADRLAGAAVAKGLPALLGCSPEGPSETSCIHQFVQSFGRRAFRRPLADKELADLEALFQTARSTLQLSTADAVALLLSAMLQAPQFLYLWERTSADDPSQGALVALNSNELGSRLSYLLWRSMPDQALFDAVDGGRLATPQDITREARRLLADPRAEDALVALVRGWFRLPSRMDDELSSSANGETAAFVKSVLRAGGSFSSLLTSPTNFVNQTLAPLYGATGVTGPELREMTINAQQRFGLLTEVSFLGTNADGAQSHPVKRGAIVFKQLLCGELPAIPANVPPPGPQQAGVSNRARFAAHSQNACAVGCHSILDPLGFAFENYDGLGRFRSMDAGQPVDASGDVELPSGEHFTFQNAGELVNQLAQSSQARDCAARQVLRLALGRKESSDDVASLTQLGSAFAGSNYDLRELFVSVVTSPSFSFRTAIAAGAGKP